MTNKLRFAADEVADEDEVLEDLGNAKANPEDDLAPLGQGDDVLDVGEEEPFEPALTPSQWETSTSGDGYITFVKKDSESDPEAAKGRYQKVQQMDTGTPDESIVDYVNAFLTLNKLDVNPKKHFTMKTKFGPRTIDQYDNDVTVVHEWRSGKYTASIKWRPKDPSIQVPQQFVKETKLPDDLSQEPNMPEVPEDGAGEEIPTLDELEAEPTGETSEENPEGEGEEVKEEEEPEGTEEEGKEKEKEKEKEGEEEETASIKLRLHKISQSLFRSRDRLVLKIALRISVMAADDDEDDKDDKDDKDKDDKDKEADKDKEVDEEDPDAEESPDDTIDETEDEIKEDEPEIPASADITEIISGILGKTRESGQSVFEDYIQNEALAIGVLYPRDFKDLAKYREQNDTNKLDDKTHAMADRISGDVDRILKSEAPSEEIKNKISQTDKDTMLGIISDQIAELSANDAEGRLSSDVKPEDIADVVEDEPKTDEVFEDESPQDSKSPVEQLIDLFYQIRGSLTPSQRRNMADIELLEKARAKYDESHPDEERISDDDFGKAKKLISDDLEGRGDLTGHP